MQIRALAAEQGIEDVYVTTPEQIRWRYPDVGRNDAKKYYSKPVEGLSDGKRMIGATINNMTGYTKGVWEAWHIPTKDASERTAIGGHAGFVDQSQKSVNGGIDFKARHMDVNVKGQGIDFQLPEDMRHVDLNNLEGLTPVILRVTPIENIPAYLGFTAIPVPAGAA